MTKIIILFFTSLILVGCGKIVQENSSSNISNKKIMNKANLENAFFAGGCFWCMEGIFEGQEGVYDAVSGYIGGTAETANYKDVSSGKTLHREGVKVIYNPAVINYTRLVELYWTQIDPTDPDGQFADKGFHYTTAIYYATESEKQIAEASKKALGDSQKFDKPIVTNILPVVPFYDAEEYHQDYAKKQTLKYNAYEKGSGRKDFKEDVWSEETKELEQSLPQSSSQGEGVVQSGYINYSSEVLENAQQEHIVLFFHADWCPTCNAFEKKVLTQEIPENILILKVDYDSEIELRKKYNIVTQTSFVLINNSGELQKRWIGGRGIDDVIKNIGDSSKKAQTYTKEELKERLTPLQYKVTQEGATEPPFNNKYWDFKGQGIYVDIVDRSPLFSSTDKYESGTGWPAFTRPIDENFVQEEDDYKLLAKRTEIKTNSSHLGHVFEDGPSEEGGLRYCINSAALDFIPKEELAGTRYEKYLELFE